VTAVLRVAQIAGLGLWMGAVVFFSFVTAPALFAALPREMAGRATAAIFPRYYALGWMCGGVALAAAIAEAASRGWSWRRVATALLLTAMLGMSFYAGRVILPRAGAERAVMDDPAREPEREAAASRFARLHGASVALNGAVLLLGAGALVLASLAPRPPSP
jgi:hypothetical protein